MRVSVVVLAVTSAWLVPACGGSSRLRCGDGTTERAGECIAAGGEASGGPGGSGPQGTASGGSAPWGQGGSSGASSPQGGTSGDSGLQGGSAGIVGDGGDGGAAPGDPPPSEVEAAREVCALPEQGIIEVSTKEMTESLLVGRWLRCDGAMFFGREEPGIRFDADHSWHFFQSVDDGGLASGEGFDNFGTWSVLDNFQGTSFQVDITLSGAGYNYVFPTFATEPSKMRWSTMLGTIDFAFIGER
jgi:hypothetical protein